MGGAGPGTRSSPTLTPASRSSMRATAGYSAVAPTCSSAVDERELKETSESRHHEQAAGRTWLMQTSLRLDRYVRHARSFRLRSRPRPAKSRRPMAQYRIRVHADAQGMHHQQLFAGLCELDRVGLAEVEYVDLIDVPRGPGSTLWIEVEFGRCSKKICYDMHDSHPVVALERLQMSDVYFKRSFNPRTRVGLAEQDAIKLKPLGLNVHAVGHRDRGALQRLAFESRIRRSRSHPLTREECELSPRSAPLEL
jgi:hypothetical protein